MISRLVIVLFLVITPLAQAQEIKPITFKIKNAGINVKGSFSAIDAQVSFDSRDLASATFQAIVDVNSLYTGIKGRDRHLRKTKYFNVETYPEISFRSSSVSKSEEGYLVNGLLSIKGIEKSVEIAFTERKENTRRILEGYFELNRRDYGVGKGSLIMGNLVKINIYYAIPN